MPHRIVIYARLGPCSGKLRLVLPPGSECDLAPRSNPTLITALARACSWKPVQLAGHRSSIRAIAKDEGLTERYVAPDIVEAILEGRQPADLELQRLLDSIPVCWSEQRHRLGFARWSRAHP